MVSVGRKELATWLPPVGASVFVLGFTLVRGAADSMWLDEAFSFFAAKRSLPSLLGFLVNREPNMGPYYLALWGWIRVDDGDLWIRFLSTLCTIAAVWGVWAVVRRWSGAGVAGLATIVFALTPFVLAWSMQARGYAMAMAFTAWSVFFADRIRTGEGRWSGLWFGVMVGLAVASQFATVFAFVGVVAALMALTPTRTTMRSLLMAGLAATAVFAPFSIAAILNPNSVDWVPDLTVGYFREQVSSLTSGRWWPVLVVGGWVSLVVASVRNRRERPYLMALAGVLTGFAGVVVVSLLVRPLFVDRYLIGCIPLAIIAAAGGWSVFWTRWRVVTTAAIVGASLLVLGTSIDRTRPTLDDYRSATAVLEEDLRPGDAILAIGGYPIIGVARYLPEGIPTQKFRPATDRPGSWVVVGEAGEEVRPTRVWIVERDVVPAAGLETWITSTYPVVLLDEEFGSIRLALRSVAGG